MKLLLIEDDRTDARFIQRGLSTAGYECDVAANGEKGLALLFSNIYDLAIVDFMMPGISGIELIQAARQRGLRIPMIILSAMKDTAIKVTGINQGADDYLTKPFVMDELLARINARLRNGSKADGCTLLSYADLVLDPVRRKVRRGSRMIDLTAIEYQLLEYFLRNPGRVVSHRTIMESIWDYRVSMSKNVVEVRICCLRKKLNEDGERNLIVNIRGLGYALK